MQHTHHVGQGIRDKMQELGDSPASCEKYPFNVKWVDGNPVQDELTGEMSIALGKLGMVYLYSRETGVVVLPTLDMLLAGGLP